MNPRLASLLRRPAVLDAGAAALLAALALVIAWLRDNSDSLDIEVAVRVAAEQSGIDPVRLRNGCLEPLEEGGTQITDQDMS